MSVANQCGQRRAGTGAGGGRYAVGLVSRMVRKGPVGDARHQRRGAPVPRASHGATLFFRQVYFALAVLHEVDAGQNGGKPFKRIAPFLEPVNTESMS